MIFESRPMTHRLRSPRCRAIQAALIPLPLMLLTAACGQTVSKPVFVRRDPPGPELTDCQTEPPMPEVFVGEASRYAWSAAAIFAGCEACARLEQLKAWAVNPPVAR